MSRNGNDLTRHYPELQELAELAPDGAVLDGETVALNNTGRPDFGLLQTRMKLASAREIKPGVKKTPVQFMLFDALSTSRELHLEGIVAKAVDAPYLPARRSASWLKIKEVKHQEVVVIEWRQGAGARRDTFGSLLLAVRRDGALQYAGRVGSPMPRGAVGAPIKQPRRCSGNTGDECLQQQKGGHSPGE